jgi:hypothetical protein
MNPAEQPANHPAHEAVWELLPWYHNDGLDGAQRALVDSHLRECLICAREVRHLRQLHMAVAAPANEQACAQAFQRLSAEIDARQRSWRERLRSFMLGFVAPAPIFAAVAMMALCGLWVWSVTGGDVVVTDSAEKQFQTLGRHDSRASPLDQPLLRVVLKDSVDVAARRAWLSSHDAELVDGPSDIGVMTVRVKLGARGVASVIEQMRAEADTLFVEPLRTTGTRPDRRR